MLTVLLATHNRAKLLPLLLEACCNLEPPRGGWKLVIVDNGSTDRTRSAIGAYEAHLPLTFLSENNPGKNAALNTGLSAVAGDLVVFTDDDVIPRPDWLVRLRDTADAHPGHAIFSGAIIPRWEIAPAPWILDWVPLGPAFTMLDPSLPAGPATIHTVFGPNMAVRSAVFEEGFRFDPRIGPRGRDYAMGSEVEFVRRLFQAGLTAWYVPDAVVEHFVRAEQLNRAWILERARRFGRGMYRIGLNGRTPSAHTWGGVPRYLYRELLGACGHWVGAVLTGDSREAFRARWQARFARGQIQEARTIHLEARASYNDDAGAGPSGSLRGAALRRDA